jgi:hypothetical protein
VLKPRLPVRGISSKLIQKLNKKISAALKAALIFSNRFFTELYCWQRFFDPSMKPSYCFKYNAANSNPAV